MEIPAILTAGDSWSWVESLSEYPAPTWTLKFLFRGPQAFSVEASASGADHAVSVAASTTANYKHGRYEWSARVTDGSTTTTIETGLLELEPDLSNVAVDHRSFNQRASDALEAVIENRATTDQLSFSIAGRSLSRMSWDELLSAYDRFRMKASQESGDTPGRVFLRFGKP